MIKAAQAPPRRGPRSGLILNITTATSTNINVTTNSNTSMNTNTYY